MHNTFSVLPETPISMNLDALLRRTACKTNMRTAK